MRHVRIQAIRGLYDSYIRTTWPGEAYDPRWRPREERGHDRRLNFGWRLCRADAIVFDLGDSGGSDIAADKDGALGEAIAGERA